MAAVRQIHLRSPILLERILSGRGLNLISGGSCCRCESSAAAVHSGSEETVVRPFADIPVATKRRTAIKKIKELFVPGEDVSTRIIRRHQEMYRDYGPIVRIILPISKAKQVLIFRPTDIEKVVRMADSSKSHARRESNPILDFVLRKHGKTAGLFFANGDTWYKYRKAISPKMLRPPNIIIYLDDLWAVADQAVDKIQRDRITTDGEMTNEIVGLDQLLFKWSFENVTRFLFDANFNALSESPPAEATDAIAAVGLFLYELIECSAVDGSILKYFVPQHVAKLEEYVLKMYHYAEIFTKRRFDQLLEAKEKGQDTTESHDLVSYLLSQQNLTQMDILSSIVDVYFAGIDTTSNTMLWALYMLSKNEEAQEKLREEIKNVVGDGKPTKQHLQQLPYLKAVVKETLRLRTVVPFFVRILEQDIVLSGYSVPAGTVISLVSHVLGTLDDCYENPAQFEPQRWLSRESKPEPFSHLPFGFGTRMCVGRRFAELELQLLLIRIMQSFQLSYPAGKDVGIQTRAIMTADRDVRVRFTDL